MMNFQLIQNELKLMLSSRIYNKALLKSPLESESIIQAVCDALKLDPDLLASKRRTRELADGRFIAYGLLTSLCDLGPSAIARRFNRDHSSVFYGVNTYNDLKDTNVSFQVKLLQVENYINRF